MLTSVKGTFKNGKIKLLETPPNVTESSVVVTFLDQPTKRNGRMMRRGILKSLNLKTDGFEQDFDGSKVLRKWERANRG